MAHPPVSWPLDEKELLTFLSSEDVLAITTNWDATNSRRAELIGKRVNGQITPDEDAELDHLQELAGIVRNAGTGSDLEYLKGLKADLVKKGVWRGE